MDVLTALVGSALLAAYVAALSVLKALREYRPKPSRPFLRVTSAEAASPSGRGSRAEATARIPRKPSGVRLKVPNA